jgi:hypothetical protein
MDSQTHFTGRKPTRFRRPLHSFSLRTVFVVVTVLALLLGWVGDGLRVAMNRRKVRREIEERGGVLVEYDPAGPGRRMIVPLQRSWLGDRPIEHVHWPHELTTPDCQWIQGAFPEAAVYNAFPGSWAAAQASDP